MSVFRLQGPGTYFKDKAGFTIVELMIVMAVAGAMLSIIFLAIPQLQRSERNTQRKNIALRLKSELETYSSNQLGVYPFAEIDLSGSAKWCRSADAFTAPYTNTCWEWYDTYIRDKVNITDPSSGQDFSIWINNATTYDYASRSPWTPGELFIVVGGRCSGSSVTGTPGTPSSRSYALMTSLESSGFWFCVDNT